LKRVYLYKEYRGKGIAKNLYNEIIQIIKEKNYKKLIVETWENFQSGINFYLKNGFKLVLKDDKRYVYMLDIE
ncbi:MAG: GNAT family N-acetyltransferase, partial [Clostridia bacterium]|nr:GNAT family N-acetyltransferase [Clostridia bacterium]